MEEFVLKSSQEQYLDWLCTAPSEREPSTKLKFAETIGVNVKTLRRWEAKPTFRAEWEKRVETIQGSPERTQRLLDSLYAKALDGDTKAASLYLQATNRMSPPTIEVNSKQSSRELTDAELDALIAASAANEKNVRQFKVI